MIPQLIDQICVWKIWPTEVVWKGPRRWVVCSWRVQTVQDSVWGWRLGIPSEPVRKEWTLMAVFSVAVFNRNVEKGKQSRILFQKHVGQSLCELRQSSMVVIVECLRPGFSKRGPPSVSSESRSRTSTKSFSSPQLHLKQRVYFHVTFLFLNLASHSKQTAQSTGVDGRAVSRGTALPEMSDGEWVWQKS